MLICFPRQEKYPHIVLYEGTNFYYTYCEKRFENQVLNTISLNYISMQKHISGICSTCAKYYSLSPDQTANSLTSKSGYLTYNENIVQYNRDNMVGPQHKYASDMDRDSRSIYKYKKIIK